MLTKRYLFLALIALGCLLPTSAQVINCPSGFASSGSCGVSFIGGGGQPFAVVGSNNGSTPALSGSAVDLIPTGGTHTALSMNYSTAVNIQAFSTTFTFIPNGWNIAFVLQNGTNSGNGNAWSAGAGCEGGFYQAFGGPYSPPNNVFVVNLDSNNYLNGSSFQYSSAQVYQEAQSPCNPNDGQSPFYITNKISTSPVSLNSPSTTINTTTGDVYSATISYDGTNLNLCLYNVTAATGSCSSGTSGTGTYFQQTWSAVNIPSLVTGNTAWIGLVGGTNEASTVPLLIDSWTYTVNSAPSQQSLSTYTTQSYAGATATDNPTFSPVAGAYSSTQTVTISDATASSYVCYTLSSTFPAFLPQTNNQGGCLEGTLYSGPITVSSNATLYTMASTTNSSTLPSALTTAAYTIGGSQASTPTFSPVAGTYTGTQSVTISTTSSGAIICYNTTGSPATNGSTGCATGTRYTGPVTVSSSQTLYAVAGGTGYGDSAVASATYTISVPVVSTPTFTPPGGTYSSAQSVTISDATSGATIYYTTNGTTPTTSSTQYTGPITVSSTETLEAIAAAAGDTNSAVGSATYTITPVVVATPTFSPAAGTYTSAQSVSISDATSGATIYYTTNGTTPTTSSTQYTGPHYG